MKPSTHEIGVIEDIDNRFDIIYIKFNDSSLQYGFSIEQLIKLG